MWPFQALELLTPLYALIVLEVHILNIRIFQTEIMLQTGNPYRQGSPPFLKGGYLSKVIKSA